MGGLPSPAFLGKLTEHIKETRPQSRSFFLFVVVTAITFLGLFYGLQRGEHSACYQAATEAPASDALGSLDRLECNDTYVDVRSALERQVSNDVQAEGASRTAEREATFESSGQGETSARTWLLAWVGLSSVSVGASLGGASMAIHDIVRHLRNFGHPDRSHLKISSGFALAGAAFLVLARSSFDVSLSDYNSFQGNIGITLTLLAVGPALITVAAIIAIGDIAAYTTPGVDDIAVLRTTSGLLAGSLGVTLTAGTLATGARWEMIGHLPGGEQLPNVGVILYGAVFTAVIAAFYVPTQIRLNDATDTWIETMAGEDAPHSEEAVERRKALREDLTHSQSRFGALGPILTIVGPIATAAASSVIG